MTNTRMFDAVSKIDEDLIELCLAEKPGKSLTLSDTQNHESKTRKNIIRTAVAAAAALSAAILLLAFVLPGLLQRKINYPMPHSDGLSGSGIEICAVGIPLSDIYVEYLSESDTDGISPDEAVYSFYRPSGDDLKYVGLWVGNTANSAFEFKDNGAFTVYIVKEEKTLSFGGRGWYCIEDGLLKVYLEDDSAYGEAEITFGGDHILLTPEYETAIRFDRADKTAYSITGEEDKLSTDALDYRNRTWYLSEENTDLAFGNNYVCTFYNFSSGERVTAPYEWDSSTNTVSFKDWHAGSELLFIGRIEEDRLILESGDIRYEFYVEDPDAPAGVLLKGVLYSGSHEKTTGGWYVIIFEDDGRFIVTLSDAKGNILSDEYYYEGAYEYDGTAPTDSDGFVPPESVGSAFIRLCPGESEPIIPDGDSEIMRLLSLIDSYGMRENGGRLWFDGDSIVIDFDPDPNADARHVFSITLDPLNDIVEHYQLIGEGN